MRRKPGTGSIYKDSPLAGPNHSGGGGGTTVYRFDIKINGIRYRDYISRIIAMYATDEFFVRGNDIRQIHHIDGDHSNWKPSNLVIARNQKQHKQLDAYTRIARLTGKPVTLKPKGAVYIGDIMRDDNFDIEEIFSWWIEQVT